MKGKLEDDECRDDKIIAMKTYGRGLGVQGQGLGGMML